MKLYRSTIFFGHGFCETGYASSLSLRSSQITNAESILQVLIWYSSSLFTYKDKVLTEHI